MTLDEELDYVEQHYPKAWKFLMERDPSKMMRPSFDDNDDMYFTQEEQEGQAEKEDNADEGIHKSRAFFGL